MEIHTLPQSIVITLQSLLKKEPRISKIVQAIDNAHGTALLVGGAVRDLMLSLPIKDLDIEVHGISMKGLEAILKAEGPVSLVGKTFGVLRLHGLDVDWSLPRKDEMGRKPKVIIDPNMDYKEAFGRRDLTINALGVNLNNFILIDPYGGLRDIENKILRAPEPILFVEDPLRFYRVMQFIGRFEMTPDETLNKICTSMDVSKVSIERIEQEMRKLLLKSKRPSLAFLWLDRIGRLKDLFPELYALKSVIQDTKWHPEGDVFEHTMQSLDAAAGILYRNDDEKFIGMLAALCHDVGKVYTTEVEEDRVKSYGHAEIGEKIAKKLLRRIVKSLSIINPVLKLVRYHMQPLQLVSSNAKPAAYKRLALKLYPEATIKMLADLMLADRRGRNPQKGSPLYEEVPDVTQFLKRAQQAQVHENIEEPVLQGRDLLDRVSPGPQLGKLLKEAYQIQIEEGIKDPQILKGRVLKK